MSEALRKLSNCGIKSGPAANDLVVMSAKYSLKLFDQLVLWVPNALFVSFRFSVFQVNSCID